MFRDARVEIKTPAQIELMRAAGLVVAETLELLKRSLENGMTTGDLDRLAEAHIRDSGATPSFLGYGQPPFPATVCVSVNDEVVHGIPGSRVVVDGDLVSIDCGAIVEGWHGDSAVTVSVGEQPSAEAERLMRVTEEAMWRGIAAAGVGRRVGDISHAVEQYVRGCGDFGIVPDYTGHGIGSAMHQPPDVPNFGRSGRTKLVEGLALAVEPMVVGGEPFTHTDDDHWTVRTDDGSLAAHFEHTFALTASGVWVLTALDGGRAQLAALGAPFGGR